MRTTIAMLGFLLATGLLTAGAAAAAEDCAAGKAEAATPPGGEATAPGNAATGWSGGLGGSHTGTSPSGAVAESRTWQPPTARGLDLAGAPEPGAC